MSSTDGKSHRAFLMGLREDGSPTCHPMVAIEATDGSIVFNTYRKSAKAQNFLRDPRASVLLLDDWQTPPSQGRVVSGVLEEIESIAPDRSPSAASVHGGFPLVTGAQELPPDSSTAARGEELRTIPSSVAERARRRGEAGKRMYFRLRTET